MLTRRMALLSGLAAMSRPAKSQSGAVYVRPPQSLSVVRADGVHVLDRRMQRDRIIGARTRQYTPAGTVFDFVRVNDPTPAAWAKFDSATYNALIAADSSIFADCTVTSSISGGGTDTAAIALQTWGTHPQLCLMIGDSLFDSQTGSSLHHELLQVQNQAWAQPVISKTANYTASGDVYAFWNKPCYFNSPTDDLARICWKFAWGGWRMATQPGVVYPGTTGAHADQVNDYTAIPVLPGQKLDAVVHLGSNDEHEYNIGLLYGSPTQGSPNLVTNGLAPLINLLRGVPVRKIGYITPIARGSDGRAAAFRNQAASDMADWLSVPSNAVSIGLDAVADSRTDPALDCRLWKTNTLDTAIYQGDRTHLMAAGYVGHLGPMATTLLDQFWNEP